MRTITNNYLDMEIVDLAPGAARGPFLVTQSGLPPGAELPREAMFVLRPDGKWVDLSYYFAADRADALDEAVFDTVEQVMDLLRTLDPRPKVEALPVDTERLRQHLHRTDPSTIKERCRVWVEQYRERRRQKP